MGLLFVASQDVATIAADHKRLAQGRYDKHLHHGICLVIILTST